MAGTDTSEEAVQDEEENGAEEGGAKKSRKKLIIAAAAALVIIAGGGGGAFVFLSGGDVVVAEEDEPPVIVPPKKLAYIHLKPMFVHVDLRSGKSSNIVVTLSLEVEEGSEHQVQVERALPRLYEAYLRTLTKEPLPGAEDGRVEVAHIKNRIRAENLRLLGPGVVHDVVLKNIWDAQG